MWNTIQSVIQVLTCNLTFRQLSMGERTLHRGLSYSHLPKELKQVTPVFHETPTSHYIIDRLLIYEYKLGYQ